MLNLKKTLKLAGVLAIVLGAAAPVMTTAASAAPASHYDVQRMAQNDRNDRGFEHRGFAHREFHHGWKRHCHHGFRQEGRRDR